MWVNVFLMWDRWTNLGWVWSTGVGSAVVQIQVNFETRIQLELPLGSFKIYTNLVTCLLLQLFELVVLLRVKHRLCDHIVVTMDLYLVTVMDLDAWSMYLQWTWQ